MTLSIVQTSPKSASTSDTDTSRSVTFSSSVTTGNTILLTVMGFLKTGSASTYSVSDSEANAYTADMFVYDGGTISNPAGSGTPANSAWIGVWRASNVTGGSSFSVTITASQSSATSFVVVAQEVSGQPAINATSSSWSTSATSTQSTGTFSTTNADCLILIGMSGATVAAFTVTSPSSPWSSFNKQNGISGDAIGGDCDYQITSGIQSGINPSWSTTLGVVYASMAIAYTSVVPPAQVTGLNVAGDATNPTTALDLSWSTPSGSPTSYTIQRASTLGGTFSTLATGVTGTTYVDSTCSPGTEYAYEVAGVNGVGTGTYSSAAANFTDPSAPGSLAATAESGSQINVSWSAPSLGSTVSVVQYTLNRQTNGGSFSTIYTGSTASYSDTGLSAGTTYGYEVDVEVEVTDTSGSGLSGDLTSEFSAVVSATTTGPARRPAVRVGGDRSLPVRSHPPDAPHAHRRRPLSASKRLARAVRPRANALHKNQRSNSTESSNNEQGPAMGRLRKLAKAGVATRRGCRNHPQPISGAALAGPFSDAKRLM